jgi:ribonuclease P protein subunit RPR2
MSRKSHHPETRRIARERIAILFQKASEFFPSDPAASDRCVDLARKIAMKQRVRVDRRFRRRYCHHCNRYLVPGQNVRVRVSRGRVVMTCLSCRRQMRFPLRGRHERG